MISIDEVVEKIKKAIRLARRTESDAERETALRLAKGLAERNGIALDDIEVSADGPDRAVEERDEQFSTFYKGRELAHACFILYQHFGVVFMLETDGRRGQGRAIWFGARINIAIARYVMQILLRECRKAWDEAKMQNAGLVRDVFLQGFFWAIHQRLTAEPLRNDIERDRELADRVLLEFKKGHAVEEKPQRATKTKRGGDSLAYGVLAGTTVNLARPCEGRTGVMKNLGVKERKR